MPTSTFLGPFLDNNYLAHFGTLSLRGGKVNTSHDLGNQGDNDLHQDQTFHDPAGFRLALWEHKTGFGSWWDWVGDAPSELFMKGVALSSFFFFFFFFLSGFTLLRVF